MRLISAVRRSIFAVSSACSFAASSAFARLSASAACRVSISCRRAFRAVSSWAAAASNRFCSASARTRSLAAVICSLAVAVSSACRASTCSLHWSVFSCAARQSFCSFAALMRSSSISCLRVNSPALRCTLPPVKLPPALIT